jgi:hypothetical protein
MTIRQAISQAVRKGYHVQHLDGVETYYHRANAEYSVWTRRDNGSSIMMPVAETFLDPAFWAALFGTQGKEMAHRMVDHVFNGGSIASFFRDCGAVSRVKRQTFSRCGSRGPQSVYVYARPEYVY